MVRHPPSPGVAPGEGGPPPAVAVPGPPRDKTIVRRFALIVGASQGGPDRVALRFAASDAAAIQHVLSDLGGLGDAATVVLLAQGRDQVRAGFERVKRMVA